MRKCVRLAERSVCLLLLVSCVRAQPSPDVLTFTNGEKLAGQLRSASNTGVVFRREIAGDITVEWGKIRDLHAARGFAGLIKNQEPAATPAAAQTPPHNEVSPPVAPQAAPPTAAVPAPTGNGQTSNPSWLGQLFRGWTGSSSLDFSLTNATQSALSLDSNVNLMRTSPRGGVWPLRSRTYIDFTVLYNKLTQNGDLAYFDPQTRTLILPGSFSETFLIHGDVERDYFIYPRVFVLAGATFDHNYAQSLDLLQSYGGGLGVVVYRTGNSEFDLRGGVGYTQTEYNGYPGLDLNIAGSRFSESFQHKFANGISFYEQAGARPAWNYPSAFFAGAQATFNVPIYHRLGLNVSSFDFWNNHPPPMLQKNIFQVAAGLSYSFR